MPFFDLVEIIYIEMIDLITYVYSDIDSVAIDKVSDIFLLK
jgi:hypothetical protein